MGLSRNTALLHAAADICVFSDEDIVLYKDYQERILFFILASIIPTQKASVRIPDRNSHERAFPDGKLLCHVAQINRMYFTVRH